MIPALAPPAALHAMRQRLTLPFQRGADAFDLVLTPGAAPVEAMVAAYSFTEHTALFGTPPVPTYVLRAVSVSTTTATSSGGSTVPAGTTVRVDGTDPAGAGPFTVVVDVGGAGDGDSFAVPLPPTASSQARLVRLVERPAPSAGSSGPLPGAGAARRWGLTALLGTTARLLWVLGAERDRLTRLVREVHDQRVVARTGGAGLDLVGADLAVPRFPPTPYSVDAETVSLYHLDDAAGAVPLVTDAAAIFPGRTAHHGTLGGAAVPAAVGRYDAGVRFGAGGPGGTVTIASHADFDVAAAAGFTVDLFVQPDPASTLGTIARRGPAGAPLWSVEVGDLGLGGLRSVLASVTDGTATLTAAAPVDLPTDRFSHVAAVLSRTGPVAGPVSPSRLTVLVDGVERGAATGTLGAVAGPLTSAGDVVLGPDATGFRGTLDEVRISRVARTGFHPALGESDEGYRARLALFRRWMLPTPSGLQAGLNRLVPSIDGIADPFVVDDTAGPARSGGVVLHVWPDAVAPMDSLDGDGRPGLHEADLWPPVDAAADPDLLGRCTDPRISFASVAPDPSRPPGLPAPDPRKMRPAVGAALSRLADLFDDHGMPNAVRVLSGWDAAATDARADGRAVLLAAPIVGPGRLAALAHRAGFDLVEHRAAGVRAACAPGRALLLGPTGAGPRLQVGRTPRVVAGTPITIETSLGTPTFAGAVPPPDAEVQFWLLGRPDGVTLTQASPADTTATLTATAPGSLALSADVVRGGRTTTATVTVQVLPTPLADGASIAQDGATGVGEDVAGPPDPDFDPAYLAVLDDPRLVLGPAPEDRLADRGLAELLVDLLDAFDADALPGSLSVTKAYQPAAAAGDLAREGRRIELRHSVLGADRLAVAAHAAGFGYVARAGPAVLVAGPPGDPVGVAGPLELEVGERVTLTVSPDPAAVSATTRLGWSSAQAVPTTPDRQGVQLMSTTAPSVTATGRAPGRTWVRATLREAGAAGPYTFEVRLRPELATARISRDQYYLVMNALNTFHPVGVEVLTEQLRSAVVELSTSPGGLDPSFTYPPFRVHRPVRSLRNQFPQKGDT